MLQQSKDWEAKRIIIFKLPIDLLDLCAAEKMGRVSKTGIVESVTSQSGTSFGLEVQQRYIHESKVVIHTKM